MSKIRYSIISDYKLEYDKICHNIMDSTMRCNQLPSSHQSNKSGTKSASRTISAQAGYPPAFT